MQGKRLSRRASAALIVAAIVVIAAGASAQAKPDFSGRWVIPAESGGSEGAGRGGGAGGGRGAARGSPGSGWGSDITIVQDMGQLTVQYVFFGRGDMQPPLKFVYALDGSETRNRVMMGRGIEERASRAVWDGNRLVITTVFAFPDPATGKPVTTDMKQILSLESPAILLVETIRNGFGGGAPTTTRTTYSKM
jgi:hypothetical protein